MKYYVFKVDFYGVTAEVGIFAENGGSAIGHIPEAMGLSFNEIDNIVCIAIK